MYKVIKYFEDLQDNLHPYNIGEEYPRKGLKVSKERITELASNKNLQGVPLIEKIEEKAEETAEKVQPIEKAADTEPVEEESAEKSAKKGRASKK